jgi:hypothetical protein
MKDNVKDSIKHVGTGLGAGLVGGIASSFTGGAKQEESQNTETSEDNTRPAWADDQISIADGVTDSMSFKEAFATARENVGAGGAFEWHGKVYNTYTAEEWSKMTPAEKADYNNHFNWSHNTVSHNHVENTSDNIELVSAEHANLSGHEASAHEQYDDISQDLRAENTEPEIEVLGVVHDADSGANIGAMAVDGQDVYVIDVNGDMEFDYMASDINNNGLVDEGEIIDIHGQGFGVNDLGGFSSPEAFEADDNNDISSDGLYEA